MNPRMLETKLLSFLVEASPPSADSTKERGE
jgi:hypothetical protein